VTASPSESPVVWRVAEIVDQVRHKPLDVAAKAVATHLRSFWDPRMRRDLVAYVESEPVDLDPIVGRTVELLREDASPAH
jgi:formate dehydrogenase subunit delta